MHFASVKEVEDHLRYGLPLLLSKQLKYQGIVIGHIFIYPMMTQVFKSDTY